MNCDVNLLAARLDGICDAFAPKYVRRKVNKQQF